MSAFEKFATSQKEKFYNALLADICLGIYPLNELLPPRTVLAEKYHVSESCVTRAIAVLAEQQVLATRQGRLGGTFLKQRPAIAKTVRKLQFHYGMTPDKSARCAAFRNWINRFARQHIDIKIELKPQMFNFRQMENLEANFSQIYDSQLPSVCLVPLTSLPVLAIHHTIHPLVTDPQVIKQELSYFRPEYRDSLCFNGSMYGFPTEGGGVSLLLYSSKRLRDAGIDADKFTSSWDDFLTGLKKLNCGQGALSICNNEFGLFLFFASLLKGRLGNQWINRLEDWNGIMAESACYKALEDLKEINDASGIATADGRNTNGLQILKMLNGDGPAVIFTNTSQAGALFSLVSNPDELSLALLPSQTSKSPNVLRNMLVWVLLREEDRETALAFLRWTVNVENWTFYNRQIQLLGNPFCRTPFKDDTLYQEKLEPVSTLWKKLEENMPESPGLEPPSTHDFRMGIGKILSGWLKSGGTVHDGQERLCGFFSAWSSH